MDEITHALWRVLVLVQAAREASPTGAPDALRDKDATDLVRLEQRVCTALEAVASRAPMPPGVTMDDPAGLESLAKTVHRQHEHALPTEKASGSAIEAAAAAVLPTQRDDSDTARLKSYWRAWLMLFLDVTFVEETRVIGQDDRAHPHITPTTFWHLVNYMHEPWRMARLFLGKRNDHDDSQANKSRSAEREDLLAVYQMDQVEVIYWRRGGLYFMFGSVQLAQHRLGAALSSDDLWAGANDLITMLTLHPAFAFPRPELDETSTAAPLEFTMIIPVSDADRDTSSLQAKGINSSTTLLAVMYLVEVLSWLYDRDAFESQSDDDASTPVLRPRLCSPRQIQSVALQLIRLFITILRTSMANAGWSATRALMLWQHLEPLSYSRESKVIERELSEAARSAPDPVS